jgi:hypothetical protein
MGSKQRNSANDKTNRLGVLERLTPDESGVVLRILLERNQNLRAEAEKIAKELVASPSAEDIAEDIFEAVTSVDIDDLNSRAGKTQWGYVEPSEAAWELLEESVEDAVSDMKRRMELGLTNAALAICCGIVIGLYKAKDISSTGALGWAPDFPAEEAGHTLTELIGACPAKDRNAMRDRLLVDLSKHIPDWIDCLGREAGRSVAGKPG